MRGLRWGALAPIALAAALAGCTKSETPSASPAALASASPQQLMAGVARQMQTCWFRRKDPALSPYKMATELDSYSGRPRVLIVPKDNPGGLPKLVVQAEKNGGRNQVEVFGPLLDGSSGPALNRQVQAWAAGGKSCQA